LAKEQPGFIMPYYVIWVNGAELKIDGKHITIYIYIYIWLCICIYIYIYGLTIKSHIYRWVNGKEHGKHGTLTNFIWYLNRGFLSHRATPSFHPSHWILLKCWNPWWLWGVSPFLGTPKCLKIGYSRPCFIELPSWKAGRSAVLRVCCLEKHPGNMEAEHSIVCYIIWLIYGRATCFLLIIIHSQNVVPSFMLIPGFWIRSLYSVWNTNHSFQMILRFLLIAVTINTPPLKDWLGLAAFYHQEWVFLRSFPQTNFLASLFSEKAQHLPRNCGFVDPVVRFFLRM
jgi:hypothetical protein